MRTRNIFAIALVTAATFASPAVLAELSANAAVTSNYVFRGITQTDDGPALQGGIDYAHETGLYAGTWLSNVEKGVEYDLYAGFAGELGDFGYDLAYLMYRYTDKDFYDGELNEIKIAGSYGPASLAYYIGDDAKADGNAKYTYIDVGASFDLPEAFALGLHYGILNPDVSGADNVNDYSVSLSRDFDQLMGANVALTYTGEDANDENEFLVTISKSFDF